MEDNVIITISGEGLSLTKKTNLQKAGQIISFLGFEQSSASNTSGYPVVSKQLPGTSHPQPRDIIINSEAKTYQQKIATLALYLRDYSGQETFTPQEVRVLLKKMGDEPRNFIRDLKSALELQYVVCIDASSDQYVITDKGVEAVNTKFSNEVHSNKKLSGAKRISTAKGVRTEVKALPSLGSQDDMLDYHALSTKGDKILWLLVYADRNGIDALTPSEVDYMSTALRDRINASGFTALNERNIKNAFVSKTKNGFQIQQKGLSYLSSLAGKEVA